MFTSQQRRHEGDGPCGVLIIEIAGDLDQDRIREESKVGTIALGGCQAWIGFGKNHRHGSVKTRNLQATRRSSHL